MVHIYSSSVFWFGIWAVCLGCGPTVKTDYRQLQLVQVWGRVTLDGKPLVGALVVFESPDRSFSWGRTNRAGKYQLRFNSEIKGTAPGPKVVRIHAAGVLGEDSAPLEGEETAEAAPVEPLPARYNTNSTLKIEIGTSSQRADFELMSQTWRAGRSRRGGGRS